jgi:hypothetical protein
MPVSSKNVTTASADWRSKSGANLIGSGTLISGITTDISGDAKAIETGYPRLGGHAVGSCAGAALLLMGSTIRRRFLSLLGRQDES